MTCPCPAPDGPLDDDDSLPACSVCGGAMEYEDCWRCGGEGEFDEAVDDAINYGPGEAYRRCFECQGRGRYLQCTRLPHREGASR